MTKGKIVFLPNDSDFAGTGLHAISTLRLHRLITVPVRFILRELGALSPIRNAEVERKLALLFGISQCPERT